MALSDLGYGRELGEGVNRMFEEMRRAGLSECTLLARRCFVTFTTSLSKA